MKELYNRVNDASVPFNILAFLCNQFGEQERETCPRIKEFAKATGVKFSMMNKFEVKGPNAHPVYLFMKKVEGPPCMWWNFGTYLVVTPDGTVESFSGVEPIELFQR
ncbi:hypothetical protein ACHAW6_000572 [Cyclotella cf. meneghiniana]